jgi:hypothetical protein
MGILRPFIALLRHAYAIAIGRIKAGWRIEAGLFLGILMAVTLLASGAIYSQFQKDVTLRRVISETPSEHLNVTVRIHRTLNPATYGATTRFMDSRISESLDPFITGSELQLQSDTFYFRGHPQVELDDQVRPRGQVQHIVGLEENTRLLAGKWPRGSQSPMEVAVDSLGAEILGLSVGDGMELIRPWSSTPDLSVPVTIVGVFERTDPESNHWYDLGNAFSARREDWPLVPLFTSRENLFETLGAAEASLYPQAAWFYYLDSEGLEPRDVNALQNTLLTIRREMSSNVSTSSVFTQVEDVLDRYEEQIVLAQVPLFLLVFLSTALLLLYLLLLSWIAVKSRAGEMALLSSRGSTAPQLTFMAFIESIILSIPAMVIGPFLALGIISGISRWLVESSPNVTSSPTLSAGSFALAAVGGVMAMAVLTLVSYIAARRSEVEFRREAARPHQTPFFYRYYLDMALLGVIGVAWWQMRSHRSFLIRSLGEGELKLDYSLLIGPALGILAAGLIVMRLFPIVMSVVTRILEGLAPSWLLQGLRRLQRDPVMPGALVVLLMVATALGVVAATLNSTVERNQRERALYSGGADLRVSYFNSVESGDVPNALSQAPGVTESSAAYREDSRLLSTGLSSGVSVLAVEPSSFAQVGWFRQDFSAADAERLMSVLEDGSQELKGVPVPENTTHLVIWAHPGRLEPLGNIEARLRDSRGVFFNVALGNLETREWQRLQAPLMPVRISRPGGRTFTPAVTPPYEVHSINFVFGRQISEPIAFFLDSLSAVTPEGEETITYFGDAENWHVMEDYSNPGSHTLEVSQTISREGRPSGAFVSSVGLSTQLGIRFGKAQEPLVGIANPDLLRNADVTPGEILNVRVSGVAVPVTVATMADYFPSLDPISQPFLVLDLGSLSYFLGIYQREPFTGANEAWLSLEDSSGNPPQVNQIVKDSGASVREVLHAEQMIAQRLGQPLVLKGWDGLLILLFFAAVLCGASAILLYCYVELRERENEMAVLGSLGYSGRQLVGTMWCGILVIVVWGLGIGLWLGFQVSDALLPLIEIAEAGVRVTPPMVLELDWSTLLAPNGAVAASIVGAMIWVAISIFTADWQRVLRGGAK